MAYKKEQIEEIFNRIMSEIIHGRALRNILKDEGMPAPETFYVWLDQDESKSKRYARACEYRADAIFDEIIDIADETNNDTIILDLGDGIVSEKPNHEWIARSRLRVDSRKWIASKLAPKKYGDKIDVDHTTLGESINIISLGSGKKPDGTT